MSRAESAGRNSRTGTVQELRLALGRLETALSVISDALVITEGNGQIAWSNRAFQELTGQSSLALLQQPLQAVLQQLISAHQLELLDLNNASAACNERVLIPGPPMRAFEIERRPLIDLSGSGSILRLRDVSAEVSSHRLRGLVEALADQGSEALPAHLADQLTVLRDNPTTPEPSRSPGAATATLLHRNDLIEQLNLRRWQAELQTPQGETPALFVLHCQLIRYLEINDLYGPAAGQTLIETMAERARQLLGPSDLLARGGPDSLVMACFQLTSLQQATELAQRLRVAMSQPISWDRHTLSSLVEVGITRSSDGATSASELLKQAQDAQSHASNNRGVALFQPDLLRRRGGGAVRKMDQGRHSESQGVVLELEPIVQLGSGALAGQRLNLHLSHADGQLLSAGICIASDDPRPSVQALGPWMARQLFSGPDAPPYLAIRLTARAIQQNHFAERTLRDLRQQGVPSERLVLELHDQALIQEDPLVHEQLNQLRSHGIRVMLDQFGGRLSSPERLTRLPIDGVKIAPNLVRSIDGASQATSVLPQLLELFHSLGLVSVALGVSSELQRQRLLELGCQLGQGPLFQPAP